VPPNSAPIICTVGCLCEPRTAALACLHQRHREHDPMGTVRRVTRNVKRWSSPSMALRWTAAAMHEAKKGFRRLKAFRQLPALQAALAAHYEKETNHARAERRHRHVIGPRVGAQDCTVVALPAAHVERAHTVCAHVVGETSAAQKPGGSGAGSAVTTCSPYDLCSKPRNRPKHPRARSRAK
jgi:hypothetical protein